MTTLPQPRSNSRSVALRHLRDHHDLEIYTGDFTKSLREIHDMAHATQGAHVGHIHPDPTWRYATN